MAIQLKVRDIRTGAGKVAEFESVDEAEAWLRDRPRFVDVLGPSHPGAIPSADEARLRQALRPFDDEEHAAQAQQDERDAEVIRKALAVDQERMLKEIEARREANKDADPDRLMTVSWERGSGSLENSDPADDRVPNDTVRKAVEAWVAERDTWVHSRGQYVVSANVVVWPGPLPKGVGEDERVQMGGKFEVLYGTPPELN
jgi:hypothetical protein